MPLTRRGDKGRTLILKVESRPRDMNESSDEANKPAPLLSFLPHHSHAAPLTAIFS